MIPEWFEHKEFLCLGRDNNIDDSFIAAEFYSLRRERFSETTRA